MVQQRQSSHTDEAISRSRPAWSPQLVHIRATIQGLYQLLIPFAILKSDPIPNFGHFLETHAHQSEKQSRIVANTHAAWDELFTSLPDEQLFFLFAWSSCPGASPRVMQTAGLTFVVATPGPELKRWFVTRPIQWQGELVAWCEEIDMHNTNQEQITEILLTEENMLRLLPEEMQQSRVA
jgi:hypothetical protein